MPFVDSARAQPAGLKNPDAELLVKLTVPVGVVGLFVLSVTVAEQVDC